MWTDTGAEGVERTDDGGLYWAVDGLTGLAGFVWERRHALPKRHSPFR